MIQLLKDRIAILAGNSRATIFSTARLFLQHGASVTIVGEYPGFSEETLAADRSRWMTIPVGISSPAEVRYCVAETLNRFGRVDTLFYYPSAEASHAVPASLRRSAVVNRARDMWSEMAQTLPLLRQRPTGNLVIVTDDVHDTELTHAEAIRIDDGHVNVDVISTIQTFYPKRQQHTSYRQLTPERISRLALSLLIQEKQEETEWNEVLNWSSEYLDAAS